MAQHDYVISNQTFPLTRQDINNALASIVSNNSDATEPTIMYAYQWWFDTSTNTLKFRNADNDAWISFATFDMVNDTVNLVDSAVDIVTDLSPQLGANLDLNSNDITGTGNINITGNITASGNLAGTLTTASQPNITSVGTLTSATVSGDLTVDTDTLYVDSTNNRVGIGTDSPIAELHIADSSANAVLRLESSDTGNGEINFDDQSDVNRGRIIYDHSTDAMRFFTSDSEALRIDSSGNVLVGKTSADDGATVGIELRGDISKLYVTDSASSPLITNRLASDGNIAVFQKDGSTVGSIGANGGDVYIGTSNTGIRFRDVNDAIIPFNTSGSIRDDAISLGEDVYRFKDAYLSGSVYLGGTTSANALDDYEEGTWTPEFEGQGSSPTITYTQNDGVYKKVGNIVTISGRIDVDTISGGSGTLQLRGFPFSASVDASAGKVYVLSVSRLRDFGSDISGSTGTAFIIINTAYAYLYHTADTTGTSSNPIISFIQPGSTVTFSGTFYTS